MAGLGFVGRVPLPTVFREEGKPEDDSRLLKDSTELFAPEPLLDGGCGLGVPAFIAHDRQVSGVLFGES
jgi:hypothetical protein